jgi:Mg/Co/Ni transporter MgtE
VFEYLSQESQEALLKGMAQDDVAELLNNMAPDDRTLFLEELPAEATAAAAGAADAGRTCGCSDTARLSGTLGLAG